MKYLIRRQKAGAVVFVADVVADQVGGFTPDKAAARLLSEADAKGLMEKLSTRMKYGRWSALDEKGNEVAAFGHEDLPEGPQPMSVGELVEAGGLADPDQISLADIHPVSTFLELYALLGLTSPPESTTLHTVAAAALHELKEMIAGAKVAEPNDDGGISNGITAVASNVTG